MLSPGLSHLLCLNEHFFPLFLWCGQAATNEMRSQLDETSDSFAQRLNEAASENEALSAAKQAADLKVEELQGALQNARQEVSGIGA